MKKIMLCILVISAHYLMAQMPHAFKYQGLARDHHFAVLSEAPISLMASILTGDPNGQEIYREVHQVTTNKTGLFNLAIGQGNVQWGDFSSIHWPDGLFYLKVAIDIDGSGQYEYAGTSPLLAVPFAMHAYSAEQVDDADADPFNEIQTLDFNPASNTLSISGGNAISLPHAGPDADADPQNEIQNLAFNPATNKLSISGGNEIQLPNDQDKDPGNELQELSVFKQFKPLAPLKLRISQGNDIDVPVTSVWNYSTKNDDFSQIYTPVPVTTKEFTAELLEVTPRPARWDHPRITPEEYQFRTAQGATGMRMSKSRLAYHYATGLSKYHMHLDGKSLRYYNTSEWVTAEVGGNQSGLLKLYPGTSSNPFFIVEKTANKAKMAMSGISSGSYIFSMVESGNAASAVWYGNGSSSVIITGSGKKPGHGAIYVADAKSATRAGMYVDDKGKGVLYADVKNFVVDHPDRPGKQIIYASLEGPEAAIYERGTAQLVDGEATIEFSEHFSLMLAQQGMTVILTPLSADSKGLAVIEKGQKGIRIKELSNSRGNYAFDWEVKGIRKGYEDFQVVRDRSISLPQANR
jgi:hypothetical protein